MKRISIGVWTIVALGLGFAMAQAAPKAELWPLWQKHDPASTAKIDHGAWGKFLKQFVVAPHPSGINRVRYQAAGAEGVNLLKGYLDVMRAVTISNYNRAEQKAYWIKSTMP